MSSSKISSPYWQPMFQRELILRIEAGTRPSILFKWIGRVGAIADILYNEKEKK